MSDLTPAGALLREQLKREREVKADLLAALKIIVDHFGDPLQVARAAIAKAEGDVRHV